MYNTMMLKKNMQKADDSRSKVDMMGKVLKQ